jgi:hypothetical protein
VLNRVTVGAKKSVAAPSDPSRLSLGPCLELAGLPASRRSSAKPPSCHFPSVPSSVVLTPPGCTAPPSSPDRRARRALPRRNPDMDQASVRTTLGKKLSVVSSLPFPLRDLLAPPRSLLLAVLVLD